MSVILSLLALATQNAASCDYCGAIFDDVRLNAWIGNGNIAVTYDWAAGRDGEDVTIRIDNRVCNDKLDAKKCSFTLVRVLERKEQATALPKLPEALACTAILTSTLEAGSRIWSVKHYPPRRRGHSRTSMQCKPIKVAA
jgi:hypothetical protein